VKETEKKCEEKLFAFEVKKKYISSPPPLHSEEPNSKAQNVNYRSFQGSSSGRSVGPVCEETFFFKGEVLVVVVMVGGNMASTLLLSSIFISLYYSRNASMCCTQQAGVGTGLKKKHKE